jgi:hypothetical protein
MTAHRALLLLLLATLAACAKNGNNASIQMFGVCSVPESCSYSATCGEFALQNYTIDVSMNDRIAVPIEVHNQLINNADTGSGGTGHTNTNNATVQTASIEWSAPGVAVSVTSDMVQAVPADGTGVVVVELMNDAAWMAFSGVSPAGVTAIADLKLKGELGDGSTFETGTYRLSIDVCNGCLLANYTCADPTQIPNSPCLHWGQWPNTFTCGSATATYTVGGSVAGQTGNLILTCNSVPISIGATDTTWIFPYGIANAGAWSCSVTTPPLGQTCAVDNATGTIATANVNNVNVHCP